MIRSLGDKLKRPTIIPVPAFALRLAFWEGADELLLCNQKMTADKLLASGFQFEHPTLDSATSWVTKKPAN
jgi:NAD dependent epimerase/dehydratase family enzyme